MNKPSKKSFLLLLLLVEVFLPLAVGLSGRWIPNGKKPAPFSKKYRDKHGIKSPGSDGEYSSEQSAPSDMKMLMFFGCALGLYFFFNRRGSGSSSSTSSRGTTTGRGRQIGSSSPSFAAPGAVRPPKSFTVSDEQSKAEARSARLRRFATKEGVAANQKAMEDAAKGLSKTNTDKSSSLRQRNSNRPTNSANGKFGTISSIRSDNNSSDTNTYDGGSSTLFQGRGDDDEDNSK